MRDVEGYGCNKKGTLLRPDLPLHDMTGGNTIIPMLIESLFPGETDPAALNAGVQRATQILKEAATLDLDVSGNVITVRVTNHTGHKLPSGYPEGRRIWINVIATDGGANTFESGHYDFGTGVLDVFDTDDNPTKIYEIKPGLSANLATSLGLDPGPSFHFAINNKIFKDNRIPPSGYDYLNFLTIQSPPIADGALDEDMYGPGQNYDITTYTLEFEPIAVEATLYYQTTSKEYVEFLRDENHTNHWGETLYNLWDLNGKSEPVVMDWKSAGEVADTEDPTPPADLTARAVSSSSIKLDWLPSTDNVGVTGYNVYYADGTPIETVTETSYLNDGLQPSTLYQYFVRAVDAADNESSDSNIASATTKKAKGGGKPRSTSLAISGANPFNPETRFTYILAEGAHVLIEVFNIGGEKVDKLVNGRYEEGEYQVTWNAGQLPSGTYFVRMISDQQAFVKKVILMK
jgi:hypothetical protein